jgi:hypothetical protein
MVQGWAGNGGGRIRTSASLRRTTRRHVSTTPGTRCPKTRVRNRGEPLRPVRGFRDDPGHAERVRACRPAEDSERRRSPVTRTDRPNNDLWAIDEDLRAVLMLQRRSTKVVSVRTVRSGAVSAGRAGAARFGHRHADPALGLPARFGQELVHRSQDHDRPARPAPRRQHDRVTVWRSCS